MEEFNSEALTTVLRDHFGASARCTGVSRGPVGNGQETWFVDAEVDGRPRALVLRRTAPGGTMSHTDRRREFETLRRLAASGLPVPPVHWMEPDGSTLRRAYFVMDRMPGDPPSAGGETDGIARELGGHLARLHAAHPETVGAAAATAAEIEAWRRRYLAERPAPVPLLGALLAWLEANRPPLTGPAVLNWGDPGPHNILVAGGRITALLDWEMTHAGHPLDDLGVAVWSCLGVFDPEAVVAGYEAIAGPVDRSVLDYFEVLASVSRAVAMLAGVSAYLAGAIDAPAVAGLGLELLSASLERGALAAGWEPAEAPTLSPTAAAGGLHPTPAEAARGVARLAAAEALAAGEDVRLRRRLKNAAALLEVAARRSELGPALEDWRRRSRAELRPELEAAGLPGDLEAAAEAVERESRHAGLRPAVRRQLLAELVAERQAFEPLRRLYGPSAQAAPLRRGRRPARP